MATIAVVGAGPAGCSAAYHLTNSGHDVTLIDKAKFPRDKTCGDGISTGTIHALAAMGIYPRDLERSAAEWARIEGTIIGAPDGEVNVYAGSIVGYCVPRFVLDNLLFERALQSGCKSETRHVRSLSDIAGEADWIIDARGVYAGESNVVGVRNYWEIATDALSPDERNKIQIHFQDSLGAGYGWIFPVAHRNGITRLNVGVGIWKRDAEASGTSISEVFERFVESNPRAKALSHSTVSKDRVRGHHLAMAKKSNRVAEGKVLRIGDAANLTDPVTGEGIQNAILSGLLVTQAITMSTTPAAIPYNWQRLYEDSFEQHLRAGLLANYALRSRWFKNALVHAMNRDVRIAERVNAGVCDLIRYNELLPSLLRALTKAP